MSSRMDRAKVSLVMREAAAEAERRGNDLRAAEAGIHRSLLLIDLHRERIRKLLERVEAAPELLGDRRFADVGPRGCCESA